MTNKITVEELQKILTNQKLRKILAYEDPLWFCLIYLRRHLKQPLAPFHREMLYIIKHPEYRFVVMMAFRGSGKSTIMNLANVLWSVLGKPQKKFVLIMSQSREQAKMHFWNIRDELIYNEQLKTDFGPFVDDNGMTRKKTSLELKYYNSRIMSVSMHDIRGLKYGPHRPDLIVCDDLEDCTIKRAMDRRSFYSYFTSEVMPLGDDKTKTIMLGNLVNKHSFLMQLKNDIDAKKIDGLCRAYPIIDDEKRILWPEKFSSFEQIKELKENLPRDVWEREFLLKALELSRWTADVRLTMGSLDDKNSSGQKPEPEDPPLQAALILQMAKFKISAPLIGAPLDFKSIHDPRYLRYYGNIDPNEITRMLTDRKTIPESN